VEPWQLIPYDGRRRYPQVGETALVTSRIFQVGETALVTSRKSDLYGKKVLVCNVKDSGVDVVGPDMVTVVGRNLQLPTALIELNCSGICSHPSWNS
jgi:hypothetical protein